MAISEETVEIELTKEDIKNFAKSQGLELVPSSHIQALERKLQETMNAYVSSEGAMAAKNQELAFYENAYWDLSNRQKGYDKHPPDSFKNAMTQFDYVVGQVGPILEATPLWHPKKPFPFLKVTALLLVAIVGFAMAANPAQTELILRANAGWLALTIVIGFVGFLVLRRRREKPAELR